MWISNHGSIFPTFTNHITFFWEFTYQVVGYRTDQDYTAFFVMTLLLCMTTGKRWTYLTLSWEGNKKYADQMAILCFLFDCDKAYIT